jgi:predicted amidophosphoribosyltransferase
MKTAEQDRLRSAVRPLTSVAEPAREPTSRMREPSRRSTGHCIRCKDDLPLNPEKPLCPSCYKIWSKYEDADYAEEYCHHCGKKHATSLRKPVCRACYGAMA